MKNLRFNKDSNQTIRDCIQKLADTKPEVIIKIVQDATKPKS